MSEKELGRVAIIEKVESKHLSQMQAAGLLGLSTRQVRNLQRVYHQGGAENLISKHRGQPSNNRLKEELKQKAIALVREHYPDFGPTLAQEKLLEYHDIKLSIESLRQLMIAAGIWTGKKRKQAHIHPIRPRRSQYGELIQIDGSPHAWFEDRGPSCCLLVFIDDATSRLMALHFIEHECCSGYFEVMETYIERYGLPLSLYSDRHGIFRVNTPEAQTGTGETQFGRAMRELNIELICASSPQAKGRVERANSTLQDRLVKEMRINNISDISTANAFLPQFIADFNKRFAKQPADSQDAHRPISLSAEQKERIFSRQEQRKISKNLEVSYHNVIYQIETNTPSYTMRRGIVTVLDRRGEISLLYKGKLLPYKTIDKNNRPSPIADSKSINKPSHKKNYKPPSEHPWRTGYSKKLIRRGKANKAAPYPQEPQSA